MIDFIYKDSEGESTMHLLGIFYWNMFFLKHGIKPLWIFDKNKAD
jgi:hypothetical protein